MESKKEHISKFKLSFLYNFFFNPSPDDQIKKRKKQAAKFLISTSIAIFASRLTNKLILTKKYIPNYFQENQKIPLNFSVTSDVFSALGLSVLLSTSMFSMLIFGSCWIIDASDSKEFSFRMKAIFDSFKKNSGTKKIESSS